MTVETLILFLSWKKCFQFFTIQNKVYCGLVVYGFYYVEVGSLYAQYLEISFFFLIINGCWIFSKAFSASIEKNIWFSFLNLLIYYIILLDLGILKIPFFGLKPTWSWYMNLLMCYWILLLVFCSGFLCLISSVILTCNFLFCNIFGFGIRVIVAS